MPFTQQQLQYKTNVIKSAKCQLPQMIRYLCYLKAGACPGWVSFACDGVPPELPLLSCALSWVGTLYTCSLSKGRTTCALLACAVYLSEWDKVKHDNYIMCKYYISVIHERFNSEWNTSYVPSMWTGSYPIKISPSQLRGSNLVQ